MGNHPRWKQRGKGFGMKFDKTSKTAQKKEKKRVKHKIALLFRNSKFKNFTGFKNSTYLSIGIVRLVILTLYLKKKKLLIYSRFVT